MRSNGIIRCFIDRWRELYSRHFGVRRRGEILYWMYCNGIFEKEPCAVFTWGQFVRTFSLNPATIYRRGWASAARFVERPVNGHPLPRSAEETRRYNSDFLKTLLYQGWK